MKKIIFLIPTLGVGGGERVVSELSLNLPDSIEKAIVLFKNEVSYPYKGRIISLNLSFSKNPLLKIYYFLTGLFRLKKIIQEENPDYIISLGKLPNFMNILASKKALVRADNFMSASTSSDFGGRIYGIVIKLFFNKSLKVISVSKRSAKDLVENFGIEEKKIKVIYNPLNVKEIQHLTLEPLEVEYQEIFKKAVIITVGRLMKQKSQWYLIRAFKGVKDKVPEAQLVILGTGKLESELKHITRDLGLERDIHFLSWQQNPFKFLARARAFVLSSLWEGLPYVLLEAMACGLPIISADCKSGPREILAPETNITDKAKDIEYAEYGILTPPFSGKKHKATEPLERSEETLKEAMIKILIDEKLANNLARKSKQRIEDFDIKNIIKEWQFLEHENNRTN
jgi:glycosyltransferase involved in cell wall biosynthesis